MQKLQARKAEIAIVCLAAVLSGCTAVATGEFQKSTNTVSTPEKFQPVLRGNFRKDAHAQMVDCVNDAFVSPMEDVLLGHVRQTRRADNTRIDIASSSSQFLVGYVFDNGDFRVDKSDYSGAVKFDRQLAASRACIERFKAP
ncbi:hypothetical protein [Variovorax paradoxus]|jgi:PBP1b-binding outer membrane lipoprotein LpoB|uniref:hypothetical protein n=1 Tax=Variovorax paradoxus TaxID=34073 RepID=UPI003393395A